MATDKIIQFPNAARTNSFGRHLIPERLTEARLYKCLSQTDLAELVGVTRQAISAYERDSKIPEPQTLSRIAEVLDQPIFYFLANDAPSFGPSSPRFFRASGPKTKKRNLMCDVLGKWFTQIGKYADGMVNFPSVDIPSVSPHSNDGRFSDDEIEEAAERCRQQWGLGIGPISNLATLLESKGIFLSHVPVDRDDIEAFSFWNGDRPFVFLSSPSESAVRLRFDIAHELGHLILHQGVDLDEIEDPKTLKVIEAEANKFAGAFLLPRTSFPNEVYTPRLDAFIDLKARWKVAIQAMIYRCKSLGIFDEDQVTNLYKQISFRRWRKNEPLDDTLPREAPRLIRQAMQLILDSGRIAPDQIQFELSLNPNLIEKICALPTGTLKQAAPDSIIPTLKT